MEVTVIPAHKDTSAQVFTELYNRHNLEVIERAFHPQYVQKPIGYTGHDGVRRHVNELRTAFPDLAFELIDQIAENDGVVNLLLLTGTHDGPLWAHVPATGTQVMVMCIVVHRYVDGRIVEGVVLLDQLSLTQQIGLVATPVWANRAGSQ